MGRQQERITKGVGNFGTAQGGNAEGREVGQEKQAIKGCTYMNFEKMYIGFQPKSLKVWLSASYVQREV